MTNKIIHTKVTWMFWNILNQKVIIAPYQEAYTMYNEEQIVPYPYSLTMTMSWSYIVLLQLILSQKNSINQLSWRHYLMSVIKSSSIECRCPGYTDRKTVNQPLALITVLEGCFIFTPNFITLNANWFGNDNLIHLWINTTSCSILN